MLMLMLMLVMVQRAWLHHIINLDLFLSAFLNSHSAEPASCAAVVIAMRAGGKLVRFNKRNVGTLRASLRAHSYRAAFPPPCWTRSVGVHVCGRAHDGEQQAQRCINVPVRMRKV